MVSLITPVITLSDDFFLISGPNYRNDQKPRTQIESGNSRAHFIRDRESNVVNSTCALPQCPRNVQRMYTVCVHFFICSAVSHQVSLTIMSRLRVTLT